MIRKLFQYLSRHITSFQLILLSFLAIILLGTFLLSLPVSSSSGEWTSPADALFTAASASCVTGLIVHDTATYWSLFGKIIIFLLIQVGGLGVITCTILVIMFTGRQIGIRQRSLMMDAISAPQIGGIIRFTRFILKMTLAVECLGAVLLLPVFIPRFGILRGIGASVFHSVSAYCNAGFDLMGAESPYSSLTAFRGSVIINLVIPFLIITGGLGFLTWNDLFHQKYRIDRYSFQTKVILCTTAVLLVIPFAYFFLIEFSAEPLKERIMMSFFQSVTPRTAGFNTADYSAMSETGLLITIFLMLCGGAPGSTAGGVKLTTIFTLTAAAISDAGRKENVIAFGRRINDEIVRRAMCLLTIYLGLLLLGTCVLCSLESISLSASMFECASALGTVGLTTGITPSLSTASKLMLASYMYFGRVGGLTLAYAAITKHARINARYPAGNLMIG